MVGELVVEAHGEHAASSLCLCAEPQQRVPGSVESPACQKSELNPILPAHGRCLGPACWPVTRRSPKG